MACVPADQGAGAGSPLGMPEPWELVADAYTAELLSHFELFARDALALAALPPASRILDVATDRARWPSWPSRPASR